MTIQFHPTNKQHIGQIVTFTKSDLDPKFIRIQGINKDLILPQGIYYQMIESVSFNKCSFSFCFFYKLFKMMEKYEDEIISDERSITGYQEILDSDINWAELPG